MKNNYLSSLRCALVALILFTANSFSQTQENFPGGVAGAEAWYIASYDDLALTPPMYKNNSHDYIKITECENHTASNSLFNFNHSIYADKLCLSYNAPLENTTSRNVFFVEEPKKQELNYSHLTTEWNSILTNFSQANSSITNKFYIANKDTYIAEQYLSYQSQNNANVNFYHWNIYDTEKKLKSYGFEGETSFKIGKGYENPETEETVEYFNGNFPEFISFPFELTANQKNRVESYLALKYGITLTNQLYKSSKNNVFWNHLTEDNELSNQIFNSRVFGIGRDDISGLNQLQSESVHNKNYLIASVKKLVETNPKKQELVEIDNEHFIVFGDNNQSDGLQSVNDFNVRPLQKTWLSQNTGENATNIPIYFKLNLGSGAGVLKQALDNDPTLKLWMLHDKNVNDQQVSDFNSQYVDYYEPASMDGNDIGYFEDVFFDPDNNIYDQFTFGVGPEMIVQVRFLPYCDNVRVTSEVVITGGKAPYYVTITNTSSYNESFTIQDNTMIFEAIAPDTYTVSVKDSSSPFNQEEVEIDVVAYPISVDLGADVVLSPSLQEVELDAEQLTDPNATYTWHKDGVLLQHYDSHLTVNEPGEYTVTVLNSNGTCEVSDSVIVSFDFGGSLIENIRCQDTQAFFIVNVSGGIPPFITTVTNPSGQNIAQYVHQAETYSGGGIDFGSYTITTTDSNGAVVFQQENVVFENPMQGMDLDLISQLEQNCFEFYYDLPYQSFYLCSNPSDSYILSGAVAHPNTYYEWKIITDGGTPIYIYGSDVEIFTPDNSIDNTSTELIEVLLTVTNLDNGCEVTEIFGLTRNWRIRAFNQSPSPRPGAATGSVANEEPSIKQKPELKTLIYPNPSDSNTTFYYEISSSEILDGNVEIYSPTGALIYQTSISGKSNYTLPFDLALSSGVYLVVTKVNGSVLTEKLIIN